GGALGPAAHPLAVLGLGGLLRLAAAAVGRRALAVAALRVGGAAFRATFLRALRRAAVVGRVEARPLVVHRDRVQHALQRRRAAHLAVLRRGLRHAVEDLEQVPVRTLVLVDRHGRRKATSVGSRYSLVWAP